MPLARILHHVQPTVILIALVEGAQNTEGGCYMRAMFAQAYTLFAAIFSGMIRFCLALGGLFMAFSAYSEGKGPSLTSHT